MSLFMSNYSIYNPRLVPHLETGSHDSFTDSAGCVLNYSLSITQSMWGKHFIIKSNADFWWIWWKLAQRKCGFFWLVNTLFLPSPAMNIEKINK